VLHDGARESIPAGLEGMRLVRDAESDEPQPLSVEEQRSYERAVAELEARDWRLSDPLELERIADVFFLEEHPRMAYPPQLRSRIVYCAYYSYLSHDQQLDRINALFGAYLIEKNAQRIAGAGYWRPTVNRIQGEFPVTAPIARGSPPMINFQPGKTIDDTCRDRMAKLLFATSYLEYCSFGNKLNLSFMGLQRRQNIDPYIELSRAMYDGDDNFLGFFTAGTMAEFNKVQAVSYYRDDMRAMDAAYDAFVASHAAVGDLFVSSLAIDEPLRGRGLFNAMWREIELTARAKGCTRIVLTVWENKSDAFAIYLKKGFREEGIFEYAHDLFFDRLHFLSYELELESVHED
jgi:ribosomal protein S18 acetylase RimI-like enzyme